MTMENYSQEIHIVTEFVKEDMEENVAKYIKGKPLICDHLVDRKNAQAPRGLKMKENRKYSFDLDKAHLIFDWLLMNKHINFKGDNKIPSINELKGKRFCKCNASYTQPLIIMWFLEIKSKTW